MKLHKFADLFSKQLGNHFKSNEKYLEIYFKKFGQIMEFYQSGKVGTLLHGTGTRL